MDVSLSQLFDKLGESGNDSIASKCYDLVASKTEAEQAQLYKMLLEMDKYRILPFRAIKIFLKDF